MRVTPKNGLVLKVMMKKLLGSTEFELRIISKKKKKEIIEDKKRKKRRKNTEKSKLKKKVRKLKTE